MSFAYIISVAIFCLRVVCSTQRYNTFIHQLQEELHPYQLTLLTSTFNQRNYSNNEFLPNIINEVPVVNINPSSMSDNRSLSLGVHRNPKAARVLTVIFQDTLNYSELQGYFHLIAELAPIEPRPKCLLVLSNDDTSEDDYETLFEHAWSLNFLEFLILQLHDNRNPTCVDYNPFTNAINHWAYDPNVRLFPNKVRDIHNHPIKIPLIDFSPLVKVTMDKVSRKIEFSGLQYKEIKIFVEHINGVLQCVDLTVKVKSDIGALITDVKNRDMPTLFSKAGTFLHDKPVVKSRLFNTDKVVFAVPVLKRPKLNWPPQLQINFLCLIGLILCFKIGSTALKFSTKDWTIFEIGRLLFGAPTSIGIWKTTPERIVALLIMLLSMIWSSDVIAQLTDIKLLKEELPLNTLSQINDSELPIYVFNHFYSYFNHEYPNLKNQVKKSRITSECFQANLRGEPTICVASQLPILYFASEHPQIPMKIIDPPITLDFNAYVFGKASPYVEEFNDVLIRLSESGISNKFMRGLKKNKLSLRDKLFDDSSISVVLIVVLVAGFSIASLVFILEVIWHYCQVLISLILVFKNLF